MSSISPSVIQLVGEATSAADLVDIVDKLTAIESNVKNDLIIIRGQILQVERMYASDQLTPQSYLVEIAKRKAGLLFIIKRLEIKQEKAEEQTKTRIQFVGAIPVGVTPLQVDFEFKAIQNEIVSSPHRDRYPLSSIFAATFIELAKAIAGNSPEILHIASHAGQRGIVLSDDGNQREVVLTEALESVIMHAQNLKLLFMNSCNSAISASAISEKVPAFVIGMNNKVIDDTAVIFSRAFYGTLCAAYPPDFECAFNLAKSVLLVRRPSEDRIPELWKSRTKIA